MLFTLPVQAEGLDSLYRAFAEADRGNERTQAGKEIVHWLDKEGYRVDSILFGNTLSDRDFEREVTGLAVRHLFRGEYYALAFEAADELRRLSEAARDSALLTEGYYFMGFASQRMGKMDEGLRYARQCYDIALACNDEEMLSSVLNNMGNIYMVNGEDSLALVYFSQTLDIERRLGRKENQAIRLGNIASAYMKLNQLEEALTSVLEGLELDRQNGRPDRLAIRLHQTANIYIAMNEYEKARSHNMEALGYFREADSAYGQSILLNALGELEYLLGNEQASILYYEEALLFAEALENNLLIQKTCNNLYQLYKEKSPARSLAYFERYTALKDSTFHADNQKQLNEFQVKYDTQQKELEIVHQQGEIKHYKSNRTIFIIALSFSLLVLIMLWIMLRLRIKRNRLLAETNATKDKLFSIISHDLKNPAIAQRNALQQLIEQKDQWDGETLGQYYNELLQSADGQVELLYNLLNWALIQAKRMPFHSLAFDLSALLRKEIDAIKHTAARKNIELLTDIPNEAIMQGDPNIFAIIIRNLLTNALKFTRPGGKITLTLTPSDIDYILSVSDTGIGMSPEQLSKLFDLNQYRSTRGTAGEQGTGLGLIVCQELIAQHGSRLMVDSKAGEGSRFWFSISGKLS